jgi:glucan phosphoethanolaminetransferase (alkaline phosphatase superfamily)
MKALLISVLGYILGILGVLFRGLYSIIAIAPGYTVGAVITIIFGYNWYFTEGFAEYIQQILVTVCVVTLFVGFAWYQLRKKKKK